MYVCVDADYLSVAVRWSDHEVAGLCAANDVQQAAVKHALVNSFSLIQGPPGTGKTLTAVRLAALFIRINHSLPAKYRGEQDRKPQLLVCGPSNKSVDVIASKFTSPRLRSLPRTLFSLTVFESKLQIHLFDLAHCIGH